MKEKYEACYRPIIYPTNGKNLWVSTPYPDILPPPLRKLPGRPKGKGTKMVMRKREILHLLVEKECLLDVLNANNLVITKLLVEGSQFQLQQIRLKTHLIRAKLRLLFLLVRMKHKPNLRLLFLLVRMQHTPNPRLVLVRMQHRPKLLLHLRKSQEEDLEKSMLLQVFSLLLVVSLQHQIW
jgi:hypothetical protein